MKKKITDIYKEYFAGTCLAHSVLSVILALITTYLAVILLKESIYDQATTYNSLVSGTISYYDYYKAGDKNIIYLFLFGTAAGYYFWTLMINVVKKYELHREISFYGICGVMLLGVYQMLNHTFGKKHLVCFGMLMVLLALCVKMKERLYASLQFLIYSEILGTSLVMLGSKAYMYVKGQEFTGYTKLLFLVQCLLLLMSVIFAALYGRKISNSTGNKIVFLIQMATPIWLVWYTVFLYKYKGNLVVQYPSGVLFALWVAVFGVTLFKNVKKYRKHDFKKICTASGALEVAAMFTYMKIPVGMIQTEPIYMFHYGEYEVSTQQLFSYGKLPFFDYFPIHGLCDYYFGMVNRIFYSGTYATFEAALIVGSAILVGALAWVLKKSTKNHTILLVMFFGLFNFNPGYDLYYIRWVMVLPYLFILNLKSIYKTEAGRVWLYVMLSILAICWNPSIGGSLAIAMLVGMYQDILRVVKRIGCFVMGKREEACLTKKFWISYGIMLVTGCGFLYPFYKIVKYILLHMENLGIVNSNPLLYALQRYGLRDALGLETLEENYFYILFAFLIPLVLLFIIKRIVTKESKALMRSLVLETIVFTFLMTNYIFGLIGEGERAFIYAGILMLFVLCVLAETPVENRYHYVKLVLIFVLFMAIKPVNITDYINTEENFANIKEISESAVYVGDDEKETNISQIQNSYMNQEGLDYLNHLNELLGMIGDKNQLFDMSNMVSTNAILDLDFMTPYSSAYNMYNETMQKHVVEILRERKPKLVLLSPYFSDSRPLAVRDYWIIRYFTEENYQPYVYEDILFLARKDVEVTLGKKAFETYAEFITPSQLENLAFYWGDEQIKEKYISESEKLFLEYTNVEAGKYIDVTCCSKNTDFIRVSAYSENELQGKAVLYVKLKKNKVIEFQFDIKNGEMLVPIGLNPYIAKEGEIQGVALRILDVSDLMAAEIGIYGESSINMSQWENMEN